MGSTDKVVNSVTDIVNLGTKSRQKRIDAFRRIHNSNVFQNFKN